MENYEIKKDRSASEMLDLYALSTCRLNDFEAFNRILFGEGVEPDFNKFYANDLNYTVAIPFYNPTTMVEYQINHYVMWGVIALCKTYKKPLFLVEYNTGDYLFDIKNDCWACEWSLRHENNYFCENCPIWYSQGMFKYMCESTTKAELCGKDGELLDGYVCWDVAFVNKKVYEQAALKVQKYPWHTEQCTDDFSI